METLQPIEEGSDLSIPETKYEYLDHTADVQLHSWGSDLKEAFENVGIAMFGTVPAIYCMGIVTVINSGYMTEIDTVDMHNLYAIEAEGDDLEGLLFHFLDEWLFAFSAEPFFIPRKIVITEFDLDNFKIKSTGYGEEFSLEKHPQGTEVKAITYSAMQICDNQEKNLKELFVIIDI